jgi:hypothetical protein
MSPDSVESVVAPSRRSFPDLSPAAREALSGYPRLLADVLPMKAAHRRHLPDNIQELSTFLTTERKELLGRDYLHAPQTLGAYLWYFLPWNMLRLARLLGGLVFEPPAGAVIVDVGAGPLTLVQALALARPDLLARELHFYCLDSTPKPMRQGRKLYFGLLDLLGATSSWRTHLVHAPWQAGLRDAPQADVLTAVNFMNELPWHRRDPLGEQVGEFFGSLSDHVRDSGQCLFMEPGNRLGGKLTSMLRESAVARGWNVLAPCTHVQPCPMLGNLRETSWCHFSVSTQGCPDWLTALSREAELAKRDLSLSFTHLAGPEGARPKHSGDKARIISNAFALPDLRGIPQTGRYACHAKGKLLLVSARGALETESGDVVSLELGREPVRDAKSQALMVRLHPDPDAHPQPDPARAGKRRAQITQDKGPKKWGKTLRSHKGRGHQ